MAVTQQLELFLKPHRNHYLFSDYYLDHRVQTRDEWKKSDVQPIFEEIAQVWRQYTPQHDNEAQTEDVWIRPVLRALWHHFTVQVSLKTPLGTRRPDYVFFPDTDAQEAIKDKAIPLTEHDLRHAFAVGDAKAWELRLDQPVKTQQTVSANPGYQIDFYIRHSGVSWGILTNGRHWRLYHAESSKKLDVYYEVDLPDLLERGDLERFKYFVLFFRREAFSGAPSWLESVLEESRAYSQGVSDNLKDQVYESLRCLAQGFLSFPANQLQPTPETLKQIYDNSLIVLYRLLFILYAESRDLLPLHTNPAYMQSYSLHRLKRQVASDLTQHTPAIASVDNLWYKLHSLWSVIDAGNAELDVPVYNGGLFHPAKHPFLEHHSVGDLHLREALDLLARMSDPATNHKEFVDYRDLEIRHLGSIYEGLLEYQVQCAEEPLLIKKENGREVYVPVKDACTPPDIRAGDVYLVTDKGERKATGSYYTPEHIVQYIVEHTMGPVLDDLRERHGEDHHALVNAIMSVNVLDPAMGSGHFLVAATDFIARYLVSLELRVDGSDGEDELSYWRRRVVQACIYGVDANPLAVELAKLSLWLITVAKEKPLSFLDHHLRCGNSLIGARVNDLMLTMVPKQSRHQKQKEQRAEQAGQMSLLHDSAFAGSMSNAHYLLGQLEALQSDTVEDVQKAEQLYRKVADTVTSKIRLLADTWTAMSFGLDFYQQQWRSLTNYLLHNGGERFKYFDTILDKARTIAAAHRFFHWELEFPDVFFDKHGRLVEGESGFDAVIGNPPWGAGFNPSQQKYYFKEFDLQHSLEIDSYPLFTIQGVRILHLEGYLGYITPDTVLRKGNLSYWRDVLFSQTWVQEFIETGPLFKEVRDTWCLVTICQRSNFIPQEYKIRHRQISRFIVSAEERLSLFTASEFSRDSLVSQAYWNNRPQKIVGYLSSEKEQHIITKIESCSSPLGRLNDNFLISRGEEGSKHSFKKQVIASSEWHLVLPEHVDRHSIEQGLPISSELLTPTKRSEFYSYPKIWIIRIQKLRWKQRLVAGYDERKTSCGMKTLQIII